MVLFHCLKNRLKKKKNRLKKEEEQIKKEEKTVPDWFLVNEPVFKRTYNTVNESVKNKLSTRIDKKRIKMDSLQHFLQNIVNGEFNNRGQVMVFKKHFS